MASEELAAAKALLEANGYTVLRTKSYLDALRRQWRAEARADWADRNLRYHEEWVAANLQEERRLRDRLVMVFSQARAAGLTPEYLDGSVQQFSKGGFVEGSGVSVGLSSAGTCLNGHSLYRVNGGNPEHLIRPGDASDELLECQRVLDREK